MKSIGSTFKKAFLIHTMILMMFFMSGYAQSGSIRGVVVDSISGERVPYATIALFFPDQDNLVTGDVSDGEGMFFLDNLDFGTYRVVISFIGYQSMEIEEVVLRAESPGAELGRIQLLPAVTDLEEVEVTALARTTSSRIDRTVYRASDFETARGGTATDILNRLPSVSVGPDGEISIRGERNFLVYLNGRPTNMEPSMLLAQISAGTIEDIEIISVPGARFDADGAGGIINITTRSTGPGGLSVAATLQGGAAPWGERRDAYSGYDMNNDMYGGSLDVLFIAPNLSLYSNLYYNERNTNGVRNGTASILQDGGNYYTLEGKGARPELHENFSASAGIVYYPNARSSVDLSYFYANRSERRSAFYLYQGQGIEETPGYIVGSDYWTYNPNVADRLGVIHAVTLDYNLSLRETTEINLMAAFEKSDLKRDLSNPNYHYDPTSDRILDLQRHFMQSDDTPLTGFRLSLDLEQELPGGHVLEAGFQPQMLSTGGAFHYDTLSVQSNVWGSYSSLENVFDLDRMLYAAYVNFSGSFSGIDLMAGLRMEYTNQEVTLENHEYFSIFERETTDRYALKRPDWFPTLHLRYELSGSGRITMAASRRINRPRSRSMAPFLYRRHHEVYEVGDPTLEPEYLTNFELGYSTSIGDQSVGLTGFYRGTDNAVFRVYTLFGEENILIRSFTNAGETRALGAELTSEIALASVARFFLSASVYRFNVRGDFFGYREDNTSTNWNLKGTSNVFLTPSLRLVADVDVRSATVTAQGQEDMFFILGAALNYAPSQIQGWNFSLRVQDIAGSNVTNWSTRAFDRDGRQIFFQETDYDRYGPIVELGITYSFNLNGRGLKRDVETFGDEEF